MQAMVIVRDYLSGLIRLHRDLARDLAAEGPYWGTGPEAARHADVADVLTEHLAEVESAIAAATTGRRAEVAA